MITPRFQLTQTESTVAIEIRAPYCSLKELDVSAEGHEFIFACRPYYLRLNLPGRLEQAESPKTSRFDADTGTFSFVYEKATSGEDFPDLDLITKLLCTKLTVNDGGRKIEVLASSSTSTECVETGVEYGFAMRGGYNLTCVLSEFGEVFEIDPHEVKLEDRTAVRVKAEGLDFSEDYFIADTIDNDEIAEIIRMKNPWMDVGEVTFSGEELDFLKDLGNVEYQLSERQVKYCFNSLVDLLFAYCYDRRTTFYEGTCESGWAVNKLSASLCCFDGFTRPEDAVLAGFRRCLIYPLYRNFDLCLRVFEDLKVLLGLGEKFIIRCLIELYGIFLGGDAGRYVLNNLFIKDYIRYSMKWDKEAWAGVVDAVSKMEVTKGDLGLDLPVIEEEGCLEGQLDALTLDSDDDTSSGESDE